MLAQLGATRRGVILSFSGPIGKMVAGAVETAPVADFTPVPGGRQ